MASAASSTKRRPEARRAPPSACEPVSRGAAQLPRYSAVAPAAGDEQRCAILPRQRELYDAAGVIDVAKDAWPHPPQEVHVPARELEFCRKRGPELVANALQLYGERVRRPAGLERDARGG